VTPEQKLLIVETLRKNGHVVGFLGDGINDASALRTADVGISVDTAADVAKGASHIILLKKSLNVVCDGIEGGRKVFGNITKYILNTMSANQGNMITVAITSLFLPFIPLLPSQILLNNMLSDLPMLSISSDNVDSVYTRKPQKWNLPFILRFMVFFGVISTIFDFVLVLILYFVLHVDVDTFRTAWFLESVLSEMIIVYSLRTQLPAIKSVPSKLLTVATVGAMIVSTAIIYIPLTASWFHFVPLGTGILLMIGGILLAYFAVTELGKALFFHWMEKKNHNGKNGNHARKMTPPALRAAEN
jgi:Mg2+-importing ATPase